MNERLAAILGTDPIIRLTERHNSRVAQIDPRVAPAPPLADDQELATSSRDGAVAAGRIEQYRFGEDTYEALWGALRRHVLHVRVLGLDPAEAFDDVLAALLERLGADTVTGASAEQDADQSVMLTWPSLDTACLAPLVRHGFAPLTSLVIKRIGQRTEAPGGTTVRSAGPEDLEWLARQAERLHLFENELGVLPRRPALRALLTKELADALTSVSSFVLIALTDQERSGFLHGQFPHGAWIEQQVTTNPTGYLSRLFVDPEARRKSVGQALITAAHEEFRAHGAQAVLLHHSLHNPLAAPLWAREGYRAVLTTWTRKLPGLSAAAD
ncbi:GNAT family N-acetyltransferase [Actinomadura luteofluorescens]|uniref:GNAT family N-acetyltransferase n=1 Tax=Actinomadura luteofluorescens TaxID=46163 RepID=UPI0021646331|nr:GNAT family N-acetyltransferase [Actinomadura glauciflava]MCR3740248.1 Ribosomal protein S18 acetylase RimI [Actinomadura glauciflava]